MSEKDINRWSNTITPFDKAPHPWTVKSGGSWDMLEVQPIPDEMLAELAQRYYYAGTPWNCRSMPLSSSDREYMYLLYTSMQGLVARMRLAEKRAALAEAAASTAAATPAAQPSAEPVAGWKLVPVQPTLAMAQALLDNPPMIGETKWPDNVSPNWALEAYRALVAAAPLPPATKTAAPAVNDWRPISTAPVCREDVLLWTPSGMLVGYSYNGKDWHASGVTASDESCDVVLFEAPTGWMPVPTTTPSGERSTLDCVVPAAPAAPAFTFEEYADINQGRRGPPHPPVIEDEAGLLACVTCGQPAAPAAGEPTPPAGFQWLFVALSDTHSEPVSLTWCRDEAAVHEAVKNAMFFDDGTPLDADHADQVRGTAEQLIEDGFFDFEGDPGLRLYRVAATPTQEPAGQEVSDEALEAAFETFLRRTGWCDSNAGLTQRWRDVFEEVFQGLALARASQPAEADRKARASLSAEGGVTERQAEVMKHALGVLRGQNRNHFVTGPGSDDYEDCEVLVAAGYMNKRAGNDLTGGDPCYYVTDAGRAALSAHASRGGK